jgi:hypothetical protein
MTAPELEARMAFAKGDAVQFERQFSFAKKDDCGRVADILDGGDLLITLTHHAGCVRMNPEMPLIDPVPPNILKQCDCSDN